jgi:L-rhamnose-H+ transport protein
MAGMSVGFATIMGINMALGSLLPLLIQSRADLLNPGGWVILLGIAGCVAGVVVCGQAGLLRERQTYASSQKRGFAGALLVCAASGVLGAGANLGFTFSSGVGQEAQKHGISPFLSTLDEAELECDPSIIKLEPKGW